MYAMSRRHGPGIPGTGEGRGGEGKEGVWDGWCELLKQRTGGAKRTLTCVPPHAAEPQSLFEPPAGLPVPSSVAGQSCRSGGCWGRRRDVALRLPVGDLTMVSIKSLTRCSRIIWASWIEINGRETGEEIITHLIVNIAAAVAKARGANPHCDLALVGRSL